MFHLHAQSKPELRAETQVQLLLSAWREVKKKNNGFLKQQKKQNSFAKNKIYVIFISCSEAGKSSFVIGGLSGAVLLRRGSDGALGTVGWRRSGEAVCLCSP